MSTDVLKKEESGSESVTQQSTTTASETELLDTVAHKKEDNTKNNEDSDSDSSSDDEIAPRKTFRSSIKLKTLQADIPVKLGRRSFRTLPTPDMDKIRKAATLPAYMNPEDVFRIMSGTNQDDRGDLNVRFDKVNIRNYDQTISDNPSVSYGPPIGLDWKYQEQQPMALEDYETTRSGKRRGFKKLGLNYYQRKALLEQQGHSAEEVKAAQKTANVDKFKRGVTKYFLPAQKLEDAAESASRKLKKVFTKNNKQRRGSVG